jgi:hypothetical protein
MFLRFRSSRSARALPPGVRRWRVALPIALLALAAACAPARPTPAPASASPVHAQDGATLAPSVSPSTAPLVTVPPTTAPPTTTVGSPPSTSPTVPRTVPEPGGDTVFPLKASASGRSLVDQSGTSFFMLGDSAWGAITKLTTNALMDTYLTTRSGQGFNTVGFASLEAPELGSDGKTADGVAPFRSGVTESNYDLTQPNETYWSRVDHFVQKAQSLGMVVLFAPYTFQARQGWLSKARGIGDGGMYNWGTWIGSRYKNYPNLIWLDSSADDYSTSPGDDHLIVALHNGIVSAAGTSQLHLSDIILGSVLDDPTLGAISNMDTVYTYIPPSNGTYHAYYRSGYKPVIFMEGHYEGENLLGWGMPTAKWARETFWWSTLSGALAGHMYGSQYWNFSPGWQSGINSPGAIHVNLGKTFLTQHAFSSLVPDREHRFVTAGFSILDMKPTSTQTLPDTNLDNNDYAAAAITPDGTLGLAYVPAARALQVNAASMARTFTVRWFDPTTGTMVTAGPPRPNSGTMSLTPPSTRHADGSSDWVLVLEAS